METERQRNRHIFEELPVPKALAAMAIPTVISQLIILIYNMADTFFIGRTNDPYMVAGASLILPIFNVSIAFANIAGTGGGTLIARLLGQGREIDARNVASFSFWFSLVAGAVFALGTFLFMRPLLRLLGSSDRTFAYARVYRMRSDSYSAFNDDEQSASKCRQIKGSGIRSFNGRHHKHHTRSSLYVRAASKRQ